MDKQHVSREAPEIFENSSEADDLVDDAEILWILVLKGVLLSMGQVYAVDSILSSLLIYLAVLLYSPLLFMSCLVGSLIGK